MLELEFGVGMNYSLCCMLMNWLINFNFFGCVLYG